MTSDNPQSLRVFRSLPPAKRHVRETKQDKIGFVRASVATDMTSEKRSIASCPDYPRFAAEFVGLTCDEFPHDADGAPEDSRGQR